MNMLNDMDDTLDFGPLPPEVDHLLQQGVAAHFTDPTAAETAFKAAIALRPETLPAHRCLLKHYNRRRQFDAALATSVAWLAEASRQANLPADWRQWIVAPGYALAALKGLAFIHLRRGETAEAAAAVERLLRLDPLDAVGGSVVAALLAEVQETMD